MILAPAQCFPVSMLLPVTCCSLGAQALRWSLRVGRVRGGSAAAFWSLNRHMLFMWADKHQHEGCRAGSRNSQGIETHPPLLLLSHSPIYLYSTQSAQCAHWNLKKVLNNSSFSPLTPTGYKELALYCKIPAQASYMCVIRQNIYSSYSSFTKPNDAKQSSQGQSQ